jgi:hypothetical protein
MCQGDTRIRCLWTYHTSPRVAIFPERSGCKRAQRSEKAIVNGWSSLSSRIASRDTGNSNCVRVSSMVPAGAITWHVQQPLSLAAQRQDQPWLRPQPGSEIENGIASFLLMRTKKKIFTWHLSSWDRFISTEFISDRSESVVYSAWPNHLVISSSHDFSISIPSVTKRSANPYCPSLPIPGGAARPGTHDHASKQAVNDEPIHFPSMFGTSYRFADLRIPKLVSFRLHEAHICHPLYACGNDRLGERRLDQPRITPPLPDERKNSQLVASSLTLGWKAVRRVRHAKSAPTTFTPNLSKGRLNS